MKMTKIKFRLNALFVLIIFLLLLAFGAFNYVKAKALLEESADRQVDVTLS